MPINTKPGIPWRYWLVIVVMAFTAYAPTLRVGFLWDDHVIIENNPWIRQWSWQALKHDFASDNTQGTGDNYYRPFQAISHRIDYSLFGLRPFGFHLTDLLFHAAAGLCLMQFVIALGFTPITALIAACLFVVHPIGVTQFLTASGRTTPLCFLFTLLCLLGFLRHSLLGTIGGLLAYALALLTKENAIITPFLVAMVFLYMKVQKKRYLVLIPMVLITLFYAILRHQAVQVQGEWPFDRVVLFFTHVFPRILWHYGRLLLWPWNLHDHRLIPPLSHFWPLYWVALIGLTLWFIKNNRRLGLFCLAWFVLNLLPMTLSMMPGGFMLDHWGYTMAPALLLPIGIFFERQWRLHHKNKKHAFMAGLFFPILILWALLTHLNIELRNTDEKLFRWSLHFTSSAPLQHNLAVVLLQQGRAREALPYFENVRARYPEDLNNTYLLARAYFEAQHPKIAVLLLKSLAHQTPPYEPAVRALQSIKRR